MTQLSEEPIYDAPVTVLRHMVSVFDECDEDFLWNLTIPSLLNIYNCWMRCGWNIYPDEWSPQQIEEAEQGVCPDWDTKERPLFSADRWESRRIPAYKFVHQDHGVAGV